PPAVDAAVRDSARVEVAGGDGLGVRDVEDPDREPGVRRGRVAELPVVVLAPAGDAAADVDDAGVIAAGADGGRVAGVADGHRRGEPQGGRLVAELAEGVVAPAVDGVGAEDVTREEVARGDRVLPGPQRDVEGLRGRVDDPAGRVDDLHVDRELAR